MFQSVEYSGFMVYVSECGVQWGFDVCFRVEYSGFMMHVSECCVQWVCDVCFRVLSTAGL